MKESGIPDTTWTEGVIKKDYPLFSGNVKVNIVIVGGGLAGVLAAYLLGKKGKSVMLLEKGELGYGTTSYTTAFLTQSLDTDSAELIKAFGKKKAMSIIESHGKAVDLLEKIIEEEKIECDFSRCSNYVYVNTEKDFKDLEEESSSLQSLGLKTKIVKDGSALGFKNCGYMELKNQAKFHPLKFLYALAERAEKLGVKIFEHSEVLKLENLDSGGHKAVLESGSVEANFAVVNTYAPFNNPLSLYFKKGTYVSYVMEFAVKNMELQEGVYEDTENPYHYLRVDKAPGGQRVIMGGEDHRKDVPVNETKNFNALIEYANSIIQENNRELVKKWVGVMLEPIDGLPSIGRIDDSNTLYASAFSGNGMTYSAISAIMFTDIISGKKNDWVKIYDPKRTPTFNALKIKGKDYAEELFKGAIKNTFTQSSKPKF